MKLKVYTQECLNSKRWQGNVVQMIVDAAITSVGLSYFGVVVPKVKAFSKQFPEIDSLESFAAADPESFRNFFKNKRTWQVATSIAAELSKYGKGAQALRNWAKQSDYNSWKQDAIGQISGVGINTFQYLRMMGGVNTVMPDKIVKRFAEREFNLAWKDDIDFIDKIHTLKSQYSPIEICWLSWLVESNELEKEI